LYFAGPLVDEVLKQALWELGGHQALACRIIHGGAADATKNKNSKKSQERKVLCIYSFHAVLCFVLWFRKTMEQPEVQQAMDLFRPINRWRFVRNS